jgi:hypothetical protein
MNEKVYERIETNDRTFERIDPDVVAAALGAERVERALAERAKVQVRVLRMTADREAPPDDYAAELDALKDVPEVTWQELGEMATLMRESADTIESLLASAPSAPPLQEEFDSNERVMMPVKTVPVYARRVTPVKATMRPPTDDDCTPASQEEPTPAHSTLPLHQRAWDLLRQMRSNLLDENLISQAEYAWLAAEAPGADAGAGNGSPAPRRLETYDEHAARLKAAEAKLEALSSSAPVERPQAGRPVDVGDDRLAIDMLSVAWTRALKRAEAAEGEIARLKAQRVPTETLEKRPDEPCADAVDALMTARADVMRLARQMFSDGVDVARSYGDNAFHLWGEQLERQFQIALKRCQRGEWNVRPTVAQPSPETPAPLPNRFDCPECGIGIKACEDGTCASCGADVAIIVDGKEMNDDDQTSTQGVKRESSLPPCAEAESRTNEEVAEADRQAWKIDAEPPCMGCGGPHPFDTSIPSGLWNGVIRAGGFQDYLCATCIVRAFVIAGVNFEATLWGGGFSGEAISVCVSREGNE